MADVQVCACTCTCGGGGGGGGGEGVYVGACALRHVEVIILVLWVSCEPLQQEVVVVQGSLVVIGDII